MFARSRHLAVPWLVYVVFVILGGAYVRATGSGAGCGDSWPLCDAMLTGAAPARATWIEVLHRLFSGLAWVGALAWVVVTLRAARKSGVAKASGAVLRARRYALWAFALMSLEALIGAGLVLLELVATNISFARAYWMAAHLLNTFILLWMNVALVLALRASPDDPREALPCARAIWARRALVPTALLLLTGVSGAVAALGDTLLFANTGSTLQAQDVVLGQLIALRIWHPVTALLASAAVTIWALRRLDAAPGLALALVSLVACNIAVGVANVWLRAPLTLQLVHLALADATWILFCITAMRTYSAASAPEAASEARSALDRTRLSAGQVAGA